MKINWCFDKMYKFSSYLFIFFHKLYKYFIFVVKRSFLKLCLILLTYLFTSSMEFQSYQGLSSCELR